MVDVIDETVDLRLIDTRQLVEEAKKLRKAKQILQEKNKVFKKLTSSSSPIAFAGSPGDVLPLQKTGGRKEAIAGAKTGNAFKELEKKQREAEKKIKEFERKQKEVTKQVNKIKDNITDKLELSTDLLSSGIGVGSTAGIISRFGPIGAMVAAIITPIITEMQAQFKRGGFFSIFLKETVQTRTITEEGEFNEVRSGTKYFTSDLRIAQKGPSSSNTQNIKYETIRYVAQNLGV